MTSLGAAPVAHVRVGRLRLEDLGTFRQLMARIATVPEVRVVVDLTDLDEEHDPTAFAILVSSARRLRSRGSSLEVVGADERTARWLSEAHAVTAGAPAVPLPWGTATLDVGQLPPPRQAC